MEEIFLCVKYDNFKNKGKYTCKRFDDYIKANEYYRNHTNKFYMVSSTMIPVFPYMPSFMKRKYLQLQLSNMFCKVEIEDQYNISI